MREKHQSFTRLISKQPSRDEVHEHVLRWCNTYESLPELLRFRDHMDPLQWWSLLGYWWSMFDNVSDYGGHLRELLNEADHDHLKAMMALDAKAEWDALPAELIVYRGCYSVNRDGLSWTLSEEIARRFPRMHRFERPGDQPLLLTGTVPKDRAVLIVDRDEQEIVATGVVVTSIEKI